MTTHDVKHIGVAQWASRVYGIYTLGVAQCTFIHNGKGQRNILPYN